MKPPARVWSASDVSPAAELALDGLAGSCGAAVDGPRERGRLEPVDRYVAFIEVLDRDARTALAAVRLVLAQPSIGSQLIDNLNASIHVRVLTCS
jgi:hypothetical protein